MIAALQRMDEEEFANADWRVEREPRMVSSQRLFRARKQERSAREKFADAARHGRCSNGANGAHRRRLNKSRWQ